MGWSLLFPSWCSLLLSSYSPALSCPLLPLLLSPALSYLFCSLLPLLLSPALSCLSCLSCSLLPLLLSPASPALSCLSCSLLALSCLSCSFLKLFCWGRLHSHPDYYWVLLDILLIFCWRLESNLWLLFCLILHLIYCFLPTLRKTVTINSMWSHWNGHTGRLSRLY